MEKSFVSPVSIIPQQQNPALNRPIKDHDLELKLTATATATATGTAAGDTGNTWGEGVRVVAKNECKQAALCLAEAFREDAVARYFTHTPDREHWTEEQRWALHVSMMEYITYAHIMNGLVLTVGPNYGCVALWMPPGTHTDGLATMLLSGMWRLRYRLSPEGRTRFFAEFAPLLHSTKAATLGPRDENSYYLVYLGTRPSARGKGYARAVVEGVLRRADVEGRAAYLESSHVSNLSMYGKWGFEGVGNIVLKRGEVEVVLDVMVREPRQKGEGEGERDRVKERLQQASKTERVVVRKPMVEAVVRAEGATARAVVI